jgi:hypothetical protein
VDQEGGGQLALDGLSDLRLRLVGRVAGDQLLLTLGATLPTGKTGLAGPELDAQRILAAPVLAMPVPALGTGFGATAGIVVARRAGPWAIGLGTSYELRGEYQPVESAIAGVSSATDLDPGDALHFSVGADRLVGPHRLALVVAGDIYGEDQVSLASGSTSTTSTYKLGPTVRALAQLDLAAAGFRQMSFAGQVRRRSPFTGLDGAEVAGSSGTAFDVTLRMVRGRPRALGLVFGANATIDSGLEVDNSLATAGGSVFGATFGLSVPAGRSVFEPYVRWATGQIDTGPQSTTGTSLSVGLSLGSR